MKNTKRNYIEIVIVILLLTFSISTTLRAQNIQCYGDTVELQLNGHISGQVQWQKSVNSDTWIDIDGETGDSLNFTVSSSFYYRAVVNDGTCTPFYSDTTKITVYPELIINAGHDTFICKGNVMTLGGSPTASGGNLPFVYSWSPNIDINNTAMSNPTSWAEATTTYSVKVTDANGCSGSHNITLAVGTIPVVDAGLDVSKCYNGSEKIGGNPTVTGGTPPYEYIWSPNMGLDDYNLANPLSSAIATTIYTITVKDSFQCQNSDNMKLTVWKELLANAGIDKGYCSESVVLGNSPAASGGSPPYTYSWSPSTGLSNATVANPIANPATSTVYTLTITDVNGCKSDPDTVTVLVGAPINIDAGADTFICYGSSMTLGGNPTSSGGTLPFTYSWSPAKDLNNATIANPTTNALNTSTYYLTVTDAVNCQAFDSVTVSVNPYLSVDAGNDKLLCYGDADTMMAIPSGGTSPYAFNWSPGALLNDSTLQVPTINTLLTSIFEIKISDANGCIASDSLIVTINPMIMVDAGSDTAACQGIATMFNAQVIGGTTPFSYLWTPSIGLNANSICCPNASPDSITIYTVQVNDSNGCTATDSIKITPLQRPIANAGTNKIWCNNISVLIGGTPTAQSGLPPYTYLWSPAVGLSSTSISNPTTSSKSPVDYIVKVSDANGCIDLDTVNLSGVMADAGTNSMVCGNSVVIGGTSTAYNGVSPYTYLWTPSTGLSGNNASNPTATVTSTTIYSVTVTDANNCTNTDSVTITYGSPSTGSQTFVHTGAVQTFTIPTCVDTITVTASGAGGGGATGGAGGIIVGKVPVVQAQTYTVIVGGKGANSTYVRSAGGGGGFSGLLFGTTHIVTAGGGGGSAGAVGTPGSGGNGGGSAGANGGSGGCGTGGIGGSGGTTPSVGVGGSSGGNAGASGTSTGGGNGGNGAPSQSAGGGGGSYGTGYGSGGSQSVWSGQGGNGGFGGGGGGGGGGSAGIVYYPSEDSAGGGGGGGFHAGGGGTAPTGCTLSGGGGGGGGSSHAATNVVVLQNSAGGGASSQTNGTVTISW